MEGAKFYERAGEKFYEDIQSPLEDKKMEAMANALRRQKRIFSRSRRVWWNYTPDKSTTSLFKVRGRG